MPAWTDYKKQARDRGSLALEVYSVISTPTGDMSAVKEVLPRHLAYQAGLEQRGLLMFAGPLSDESGEFMEGVGQIIYRCESIEQARGLADSDPMHAEGARNYCLRRWLINEGSLQIGVALSAQKVSL